MKIFAVRDEAAGTDKDVAYLIYYETEKKFYIELPENADPWETPLLLSSLLKRGEKTVNAYWSKLWVQQRIIPPDRQNLGQILRDNGMDCYDEFALLALAEGRCAQDGYYLTPITADDMPENFAERFSRKVEDVVPLPRGRLLVFFRDGLVKKIDVRSHFEKNAAFAPILRNEGLFRAVSVQTGGYGVCWGENLNIADKALYENGETVPLSMEDFRCFVENRVVNTAEAAEMLECSRQNINDLVLRGKLHPVKKAPKDRLFLKSEVLQRKWN